MDDINEIMDNISEFLEKTQKNENFLINKLRDFLKEFYENNSQINIKEKIFLNNKNTDVSLSFLLASENYYNGSISLNSLINERSQAWKLFDSSSESFRFFLNLIIYTMYDYEKEEIAKEGGDIDDLISIIIIDLHDIHPFCHCSLKSSLFSKRRLGQDPTNAKGRLKPPNGVFRRPPWPSIKSPVKTATSM